ncbi:MAG: histidine kinase dimerization/phospho-acceptor domain-containing protein [Bacteroidota bacterium]
MFLSASTFDAVLLAPGVSAAWDDETFDALIKQWADSVPLVLVTAVANTRTVVEALRGGFVDVLDRSDLSRSPQELGMRMLAAMQQRATRGDSHSASTLDRLTEIRAKASKVYHDVNNPLAIISGNAQLFLELSSILGADEDLVQPVRDIDAASARMAELLRGLIDIKQLASAETVTERA